MPVLIFLGVLLLIFMIGILPVVNLVLLSSCKSRIEDLLFRIKELEKAVKDINKELHNKRVEFGLE